MKNYLLRNSCLIFALVFLNFHAYSQLCPPDPNAPQPEMNCNVAPIVCELENFCSTLPLDSEFPDIGVSGCPGFSALNNPAYFSFIATSTNITITVVYANCTTNSPGIQLAVLTSCPGSGGQMQAVPGTCWQNCNSTGGSTTIGGNTFIIGQQYWFVLDGCSGSVCEYQIVNTIGIEAPSLVGQEPYDVDLEGPTVVCPGETFNVEITNGIFANEFIWTEPFLGNTMTVLPEITITIPENQPEGPYTVCLLDADNPCSESLTEINPGYTGACFTFNVAQIPETDVGPISLCLDSTYFRDGLSFTPGSAGTFTTDYMLTSPRGCDSIINLTLDVIYNEPIVMEATICAGSTITDPITGDMSAAGTYAQTITNANGCPQEYEFTLKTIEVSAILDPTNEVFFVDCPSDPIEVNGGFTSTAILQLDNEDLSNGLTFEWLLNGAPNSTDPLLFTIVPGLYTFIATYNNNGEFCRDTADIQIEYTAVSPEIPQVAYSPSGCYNNTATFELLTFDPSVEIQWDSPFEVVGLDNTRILNVVLNSGGLNTVCVTVTNPTCTVLTETFCFDVQVDDQLAISIGGDDRFCEGDNILLTAQSGVSNPTYEWSTSSTNSSITVDAPGTYMVTVTDDIGCTGESSVTITEVSNPEPMITGSRSYCTGSNTTLTATGGPYTDYEWSGAVTSSMPSVTVNTPGMILLTVTNADGCIGTATVNVTEQTELSPEIAGPPDFCTGETVTLDAGAFFTGYLWSNSATTSTIETTAGGLFSVTVTDASGCTGTSSVTVVQNNNPAPMITTPALQICPEDDALLTVSLSGLDYQWSNNTMDQTLLAANPGTYSVTVTDANGCTGTSSVTVTEFASPSPVIAGQDYYCAGGDVSIGLNATFAEYEWSGGVPQNAQNTTVSAAGTYMVTVTDANGCSATSSFVVREEANPVPVIQGMPDVCEGFSVTLSIGQTYAGYSWSTSATTPTIDVNATGTYIVTVTNTLGCEGTAQYNVTRRPTPEPVIGGSSTFCIGFSATLDAGDFEEYLWSTGETTAEIEVDVAGDYCVTVTDQYGCVADTCKTIMQDTELNTTVTGEPSFCAGDSTRVDAGGGFATYTWSGGLPSTRQVWISAPGTYTVTVSDASGCTGSASVTIIENSLPEPEILGPGSFCTGNTATLDGGDWESYQWSTGAISRTINVSSGGLITLDVTDMNGCEGSTSRLIEELAELSPGITGDRDFCAGLSTTLTIESGYTTYEWLDNSSVNPERVFTAGGTFTVRVTDADGCSGTGTVTVEVLPLPAADAGLDKELTCRDSVQTIGGNNTPQNGHTYEWKEIGATDVAGTGRFLQVTAPGVYELLVINAQTGCERTDTVEVTLNANLITDAEIRFTDPTCFNDRDGAIEIDTVFGGTGPYTYRINNQAGQQIQGLSPGSYRVEIEDANGCRFTTDITLNNPEQLTLDVGPDVTMNYGDTLVVVPVTNMSPPYRSVVWEEGNAVCAGCIDLVLDIIPELSNVYRLTLTDDNGCEVSDFLRVTLKRNRNVFAPTAFSPNYDGTNERFTIYAGRDVLRVKSLQVFDRWGEMVFTEEDFPPSGQDHPPGDYGWDGTYGGQELTPSTYVYKAEVEFIDGEVIQVYGEVALMR